VDHVLDDVDGIGMSGRLRGLGAPALVVKISPTKDKKAAKQQAQAEG